MSLSGNASTDKLLVGEVRGLNSIHGKSAYELAVIHGFEGTEEEWIASLKGEKGDAYILTEADKEEIADKVAVGNLQESAEKYIDSVIETKDLEVTRTATGKAITIDSANAPLQNLKLYGKTTQNGTPTPDAPVPLVSVGDSGSFEVGVYRKNLLNANQSYFLDTPQHLFPDYLPILLKANTSYTVSLKSTVGGATELILCNREKVKVNSILFDLIANKTNVYTFYPTEDIYFLKWYVNISNVTLTDLQIELGTQATPYEPYNKQTLTMPYTLRGQGNVKDEVDFTRGVFTPRLKEVIFKGVEEWGYMAGYGFFCYIPDMKKQSLLLSNLYPANNTTTIKDKCVSTKFGSGDYIWLFDSDYNENVDSLKTSLASNPMTVIYELATPIETALTETELNAYRQLYTNKGTTTVLSEADMELDYYVNKPNAQAIGNLHSIVNADYIKCNKQ